MNGIIESIFWVGMGFVPTLFVMEAAWRISRRKLAELGVRAH